MKKLICLLRLHWLFDVPVYRCFGDPSVEWRCKRCHKPAPFS